MYLASMALNCFVLQVDQLDARQERSQALLFKVGDDCRQDVLALQVHIQNTACAMMLQITHAAPAAMLCIVHV